MADKFLKIHQNFINDLAVSVSHEMFTEISHNGLSDRVRLLDLMEELLGLINSAE